VRLFRAWADSDSLVARRCPTLWLEFDDCQPRRRRAVPSVSACITENYRIDQGPRPQDPEDRRLADEVLTLLDAAPDPELGRRLDVVFDELPPGARWIHVSYMLGRTPRALKLYGVIPRSELLGYLAKVGWAGDMNAIEQGLPGVYPEALLADSVFLDLNLENLCDRRRATLGLAVAQQHLRFGHDADPTREAILDRWQSARMADPAKIAAVRAWPRSAEQVPVKRFERESRFLDVKLVWQESTGFVAKAYVGRQRMRGLF
jgi:hypothetical protein